MTLLLLRQMHDHQILNMYLSQAVDRLENADSIRVSGLYECQKIGVKQKDPALRTV